MKHSLITPGSRTGSVAALVFVVAALSSGLLIWQMECSRLRESRALATNMAAERAYTVQHSINHALSATHALAAMVRQGKGSIQDFRDIATQMLPFYPGASSLALAPGGVVREIVPLIGNEKAIGHDLLKDPLRTKEAFLARDTGKLTLAGPFELVQGGYAAAGRLPVFLDDNQGGTSFWGLTAILIKFPDALAPAQFQALEASGFIYELWRIHPDSGKKQVIAASSTPPPLDPVEIRLQVPNATWTLAISPSRGWGDVPGLSFKAVLGLLFSLLLAGLTKLLLDARNQGKLFEIQVSQHTSDLRRFSEITAHHLQEPARRMACYAELLGRQLAGKLDDPEARLSLDFIGQQARHQQALLRDIERYLAADQPRGELALTDVRLTVAALLARAQDRISAAGAKITVGELPPAWIDAPRLADLFEVVLDNALQHAGAESRRWRDGTPETNAAPPAAAPLHITLDGECVGSRVRYCISDNGTGIEKQYRERVFRAFERLESGGHDNGTGIGLAIVRRIVESCGGRAWIEETPGGGCSVLFELSPEEST